MTSPLTDAQKSGAPLILVVEDEYLVAQELANALVDGGFQVLGPVSTVGTALFLMTQRRPDAAVLDVVLRNDLVSPVARTLDAMGVPFLVASAFSLEALWGEPVIASARMLGKPTDPSELIGTLKVMLAEPARPFA